MISAYRCPLLQTDGFILIWLGQLAALVVEPTFTLEHLDRSITFATPSDLALIRARSVLTKEPGTIAWIDSFALGESMWDVGANVGPYSLYAAVFREARVLAIEPAAHNYYLLNRNIALNHMDGRVKALCLALDRQDRFGDLNMQDQQFASALHAFGEAIDYKSEPFTPTFTQGSLGMSADSLLTLGAFRPDHVKIDVDGLERAVVAGAVEVLSGCRTALVELDLRDDEEVREITLAMKACGMIRDREVPGNAPRPLNGALIYNMVFRRP